MLSSRSSSSVPHYLPALSHTSRMTCMPYSALYYRADQLRAALPPSRLVSFVLCCLSWAGNRRLVPWAVAYLCPNQKPLRTPHLQSPTESLLTEHHQIAAVKDLVVDHSRSVYGRWVGFFPSHAKIREHPPREHTLWSLPSWGKALSCSDFLLLRR